MIIIWNKIIMTRKVKLGYAKHHAKHQSINNNPNVKNCRKHKQLQLQK